ncbi:hypothetical protein Anas_10922, partial [Armadillidium nasatum]
MENIQNKCNTWIDYGSSEYFLLVIMVFPPLTTRMVWIITLLSKVFSSSSDLMVTVHNCSSHETIYFKIMEKEKPSEFRKYK